MTEAKHGSKELLAFALYFSRLPLERKLELLRQACVEKTIGGIVGKPWITDSVSTFTECFRRILIKDIVASNSDARALE